MDLTTSGVQTMTSRELAELYSKPHNDVLKKIRKLEAAYITVFGNEGSFSHVDYRDSKGEMRPEILLNKSQALFVASRFNVLLHAKVQKRWEDLERNSLQAALPQDFPTALRMLANEVEQKQLALAQRDEAIKTKAYISDKKTATAMNTASQAVRRANRLEEELGRSTNWKAAKVIPWIKDYLAESKGMWIVLGKKLKALSDDMGIEVHKIESDRYGQINAYHTEVIEKLRCRLEADSNMMGKYRIDEA